MKLTPWNAYGVPWTNPTIYTIRNRVGTRIAEVKKEEHTRLIAAAPELLKALQTFCDVHAIGGFIEPDKEVIKQAQAAIQKATLSPNDDPPEGYMDCQRCGDPTWNIELGQCRKCGFTD